jgi:hypothetical protein
VDWLTLKMTLWLFMHAECQMMAHWVHNQAHAPGVIANEAWVVKNTNDLEIKHANNGRHEMSF